MPHKSIGDQGSFEPLFGFRVQYEETVRKISLTIDMFKGDTLLFTERVPLSREKDTVINHNEWEITITPQRHLTFLKGGIRIHPTEVK